MISGLRMLPRVQAERQRQRDEGSPYADDHMSCATCPDRIDVVTRAEWRCGWMRSFEWREGMTPHREDVCPGYSIQLPEVLEAARLRQWRNHGSLSAVVDDFPLPQCAITAVDVLDSAASETEADMIREASRKRGPNGPR